MWNIFFNTYYFKRNRIFTQSFYLIHFIPTCIFDMESFNFNTWTFFNFTDIHLKIRKKIFTRSTRWHHKSMQRTSYSGYLVSCEWSKMSCTRYKISLKCQNSPQTDIPWMTVCDIFEQLKDYCRHPLYIWMHARPTREFIRYGHPIYGEYNWTISFHILWKSTGRFLQDITTTASVVSL